ncbi:hypothetical protein [Lacinutrix sp.]|uniref:hypothetical protein n=1 Tax=Lacinutrix sp. TaxID=1937692 RepID=UPI0025C03F59|nr:hypothetical protein [Lacinutrix sp.]
MYDFSVESLIQVIESCEKSFDSIMVFGHNYALTNFVNKYGDKYIENVITSGFIKIVFEIDS